MEDSSFSSHAFELDQQTHHFEEPTLSMEVPYSHASNYEQNLHDQAQPSPQDQQLPEPAQFSYQARQMGPTQFGPKSPSMLPNAGPNRPPPFPAQPIPAHPVQTIPVNPLGPRTRTINPPVHNPALNMGLPFGESPSPAHQTTALPMKFSATSGEPEGTGGMSGYTGGPPPRPGQLNGAYGIPIGTEGWRTGLFDCMDDPMNAFTTAIFPCVTFGQVAEIIDNGNTSCATSGLMYGAVAFCIAMPCILSCTYRTKLRSRFGLMETPAPDWITHFLCECCALCQEYRELQRRGIDPSIGYQGNVARMGFHPQEVNMTPPMHHRMMA